MFLVNCCQKEVAPVVARFAPVMAALLLRHVTLVSAVAAVGVCRVSLRHVAMLVFAAVTGVVMWGCSALACPVQRRACAVVVVVVLCWVVLMWHVTVVSMVTAVVVVVWGCMKYNNKQSIIIYNIVEMT